MEKSSFLSTFQFAPRSLDQELQRAFAGLQPYTEITSSDKNIRPENIELNDLKYKLTSGYTGRPVSPAKN
ncbi:hypothetical protein N7456_006402 [Penicillium angulare]|uniref:Uncharacterized protein n=1 Tax=Penicillium angulare TaxID=116970 RepID=A0A9W9KBM4_9EURO|nr:hypothetical protein N7456_006402 [Penicillium angulare]